MTIFVIINTHMKRHVNIDVLIMIVIKQQWV